MSVKSFAPCLGTPYQGSALTPRSSLWVGSPLVCPIHRVFFYLSRKSKKTFFWMQGAGTRKTCSGRIMLTPLLSLILEMSCTAWVRASLLIRVPRALEETSEAASVAPCSCQDQWWNLSQWRIRDQSTWLWNRSVWGELPSLCSLIPQPCHLSGSNNCGHLEHSICLLAQTSKRKTHNSLPHLPCPPPQSEGPRRMIAPSVFAATTTHQSPPLGPQKLTSFPVVLSLWLLYLSTC